MTIVGNGLRRRRRTPIELRAEAIEAARSLLLNGGPASVTLQGVAAQLGVAHGNITHHFGSAGSLQAALADDLLAEVIAAVELVIEGLRAGRATERNVVDSVFDAFDQTGAGRLIAWLAAQRSPNLDSLYDRVRKLTVVVKRDDTATVGYSHQETKEIVCDILLSALGASLMQDGLVAALGLTGSSLRSRLADGIMQRRALTGEQASASAKITVDSLR